MKKQFQTKTETQRTKRQINRFNAKYDFGITHSKNEIPIIYNIRNPDIISDPFYNDAIPYFKPIEILNEYISPHSTTMKIANRISFLNKKISNIYFKHQKILISIKPGTPITTTDIEYLNFDIADVIHHTKRILDIFIVSAYLEIKSKIETKSKCTNNLKIECSGIGYLFKNTNDNIKNHLLEKINFEHFKDLLSIINESHNAYKHDILCEQLNLKFFLEPCINTYKFHQLESKGLKYIRIYQIELRKIIFATNDFLTFLLKKTNINNIPKLEKIETKL